MKIRKRYHYNRYILKNFKILGMVLLLCVLVTPELWKLIQEDHRFYDNILDPLKIWTMKQDLDSKDKRKNIFQQRVHLKKAQE